MNYFKTLTFGDLKKDDKKIEETYQKLKDSLTPIKNQSTSSTKIRTSI